MLIVALIAAFVLLVVVWDVQQMRPNAVGGQFREPSNSECTVLGFVPQVAVAVNSYPAPLAPDWPSACASPFLPAPCSPRMLPAATCRPPGAGIDSHVSPSVPCLAPACAAAPTGPALPPAACASDEPVHANSVQFERVPSKRRLCFPLSPKLTKQFKLG